MELPKLTPGKRFTLPRPVGSADALLLARLGEREKAAGRVTAIVTADASDAQRLNARSRRNPWHRSSPPHALRIAQSSERSRDRGQTLPRRHAGLIGVQSVLGMSLCSRWHET